ncbi:MBL fold metallo-hydrolase [Cryobacterium sp. N21]|uniref:MBL fold metallo-hydrolase n=1 Tax=Cryobacterium sp. N21 TaxID=2048289 RepID=UPI0011250C95|nr:MBL fold metallo-hydrolase [Cryobacterium sp. N21]
MEVIGCSAGSPQGSGAASGYLLQAAGLTILIDCGPGVVSALAASGRLDDLDAVIISHEHFDHSGDLMALAYHRAFPVRRRPLPLYAPKSLTRTLRLFDELFGIPSLEDLRTPLRTQLNFVEVEIGSSFSIGDLRIDTLAASHPVPTMSMRFPQVGLVYTADTALTPELIRFSQGSILLAEATYVTAHGRDFSAHGHMSGIEAGRLALEAESPLLVLTHFADPRESADTLAYSAEHFSGLVTRATPGMILPLDGRARVEHPAQPSRVE